jgi:hypothetical protein
MQEAALQDVLVWARQGLTAAQQTGSGLDARPRWDAIAVAGHSRGGDVAYHQLQLFPWVKYAVLIDPVKQPHRAITSTDKPYTVIGALGSSVLLWQGLKRGCWSSAILQLACHASTADAGYTCSTSRSPLHMPAALLISRQNCSASAAAEERNACDAAGKGSRLCCPPRLGPRNFVASPQASALRIPRAGHAQFWRAPGRWQGVSDFVCGTAGVADAVVREWTGSLTAGRLLQNLPVSLPQVRSMFSIAGMNMLLVYRLLSPPLLLSVCGTSRQAHSKCLSGPWAWWCFRAVHVFRGSSSVPRRSSTSGSPAGCIAATSPIGLQKTVRGLSAPEHKRRWVKALPRSRPALLQCGDDGSATHASLPIAKR